MSVHQFLYRLKVSCHPRTSSYCCNCLLSIVVVHWQRGGKVMDQGTQLRISIYSEKFSLTPTLIFCGKRKSCIQVGLLTVMFRNRIPSIRFRIFSRSFDKLFSIFTTTKWKTFRNFFSKSFKDIFKIFQQNLTAVASYSMYSTTEICSARGISRTSNTSFNNRYVMKNALSKPRTFFNEFCGNSKF